MQQVIGIIGATGDLGQQLVARIEKHGFEVRTFNRSDPRETLEELTRVSSVIHICAPVEAAKGLPSTSAIIVLHDSVMHTSKQASEQYLNNNAAIVHMLMNKANTVIVANDAPHHTELTEHLSAIGLSPQSMSVREHDYMIARSQAPLALLIKALLPYLYEQADEGLLTPSGQLLADTLRSRELIWTNTTIHSILQNPELDALLHDLQTILIQERNTK
ncbi:NmrA family NAD(P)-binding protein [Streptomyces caniscabiei]|uniref:NAD(P)-binding domain-containing protein n=1 Tax=Streptomyces caniscabiei TaxID=2746961 RepID=UPI0029B7BC27|nr:NmrA family NAD(P)-binding protein [Streptomyces caniscabiei]MDX2775955.1 NmrA family NAD(P)-binding protein [Streptomyces caniscabiei]